MLIKTNLYFIGFNIKTVVEGPGSLLGIEHSTFSINIIKIHIAIIMLPKL